MYLIIGAFSSIIFGVITDNKIPGKLGKRRPFLLYGLPSWFLASILIWMPPWKCPKTNSLFLPTILYFLIILFIQAISGSIILSGYNAMLPEQSQTHENRKKVASITTILVIIASILALLLPLMVESLLEDPEKVEWWNPSGETILYYMPMIGFIFALFGIISILLTFFSVDESFHSLNKDVDFKKKSLNDTFNQMIVPARDKKYRKFLVVQFFINASGRVLGILVIPFLTYILMFRKTEFFIYIIISISCKFGWFYVLKKVLEKKRLIKTIKICIFISIIVSFLELLFLIPMLSFNLKIILFIITIGTLLGTIYSFGLFLNPLAGALVYEAAEKQEEINIDEALTKLSGSYFGLQSCIIAFGQAFASIMMGLFLTGESKHNPTVITLCLSLMGVFYVISWIFMNRINLDSKKDISPIKE